MNLKRKIIEMGLLMLGMSEAAFAKEAAPKPKVVDLNQIDLEQVEDNWENGTPNPPVNLDRGPKIKDIVEPTSEYIYASFGKPDPFAIPDFAMIKEPEPAAEEGPMTSLGPNGKEISIQSPLQAYPLDALTVKGVWQLAEGEMRAVIQTPKKEGIVIKNGDPMSSGKVLQIEKDAIVVRLYKLRKDGVREYEDKRLSYGLASGAVKGSIKLQPGKDAQFPGMEKPADSPGGKVENGKKTPKEAGQANPSAKAPAPGVPGAGGLAPGAVGNPPGWPYNAAPPAPPAAPGTSRPGSSTK